jgi:hypothetical protein
MSSVVRRLKRYGHGLAAPLDGNELKAGSRREQPSLREQRMGTEDAGHQLPRCAPGEQSLKINHVMECNFGIEA